MSLKKQVLKSKPVCKVTFRVSKDLVGAADSVALVGDFNGWDTAAVSMNKLKSGEFTSQLELEKGKAFEFRYLVNGAQWVNDPEADSYSPNVYGEENSVVEAL